MHKNNHDSNYIFGKLNIKPKDSIYNTTTTKFAIFFLLFLKKKNKKFAGTCWVKYTLVKYVTIIVLHYSGDMSLNLNCFVKNKKDQFEENNLYM